MQLIPLTFLPGEVQKKSKTHAKFHRYLLTILYLRKKKAKTTLCTDKLPAEVQKTHEKHQSYLLTTLNLCQNKLKTKLYTD